MASRSRILLVAVGVGTVASAVALSGCGTPAADAGDLAEQVREKVAARISVDGATVEDVACDRDLEAKKGSTATCTFNVVLGGVASRNVGRATVTEVDTVDESLEFFIAPVSWAAPAEWLARAVAPLVQAQVAKLDPAGTLNRVACARDLSTTSTATTACVAIWTDSKGSTYREKLRVTVDKGGDVDVRSAN